MNNKTINEKQISYDSLILLGLLYEILQNMVGKRIPIKGWKDFQYLLKQLWVHSMTVFALKGGIVVKLPWNDFQETFFEAPSVLVLTRIIFETYFIIRQVFINTIDNSEMFEFEYLSWKLSGYVINSNSYVESKREVEEARKGKEYLNSLKESMQNNVIFRNKTSKEKDSILKGRRKINWDEISNQVGFSTEMQSFFRQYLSSFVHPDGFSVDQIAKLGNIPDNVNEILLMMNMINVVLAKVIMDLFFSLDIARETCQRRRIAANLAFDLSGIELPDF